MLENTYQMTLKETKNTVDENDGYYNASIELQLHNDGVNELESDNKSDKNSEFNYNNSF